MLAVSFLSILIAAIWDLGCVTHSAVRVILLSQKSSNPVLWDALRLHEEALQRHEVQRFMHHILTHLKTSLKIRIQHSGQASVDVDILACVCVTGHRWGIITKHFTEKLIQV